MAFPWLATIYDRWPAVSNWAMKYTNKVGLDDTSVVKRPLLAVFYLLQQPENAPIADLRLFDGFAAAHLIHLAVCQLCGLAHLHTAPYHYR